MDDLTGKRNIFQKNFQLFPIFYRFISFQTPNKNNFKKKLQKIFRYFKFETILISDQHFLSSNMAPLPSYATPIIPYKDINEKKIILDNGKRKRKSCKFSITVSGHWKKRFTKNKPGKKWDSRYITTLDKMKKNKLKSTSSLFLLPRKDVVQQRKRRINESSRTLPQFDAQSPARKKLDVARKMSQKNDIFAIFMKLSKEHQQFLYLFMFICVMVLRNIF